MPNLGPPKLRTWGGLQFVRVPTGKFLMGKLVENMKTIERPQHTVEMPYDYWIARYPVTNDQFVAFIRATHYTTIAEQRRESSTWCKPYGPESDLKNEGDHPVVYVSWYDAMAYCQWLNDTLRVTTQA